MDIVLGSMYLMGDFNSVTSTEDCLSGHLDQILHILKMLLEQWDLTEPPFSPSFTYQHPTASDQKSRIDRLYASAGFTQDLYMYTQWCSCSNHLAMISVVRKCDKGSPQWCLPMDLLDNPKVLEVIQKMVWIVVYHQVYDGKVSSPT